MAAAMKAAPKESRSAASVRGWLAMRQNSAGPTLAALKASAASGISTTSDSAVTVMPKVIPNPGITL